MKTSPQNVQPSPVLPDITFIQSCPAAAACPAFSELAAVLASCAADCHRAKSPWRKTSQHGWIFLWFLWSNPKMVGFYPPPPQLSQPPCDIPASPLPSPAAPAPSTSARRAWRLCISWRCWASRSWSSSTTRGTRVVYLLVSLQANHKIRSADPSCS